MEEKKIFVDLEGKELYHHGIMGMRWGVRRYQPYSVRGRKSGKGGREVGEAREKVSSRAIKKYIKKREKQMRRDVKNRRFLSDRDLKRKIERIEMEQRLKSLTEDALTPGKRATKKILKETGQDLAKYVLMDIGKSAYHILKNSLGKEKSETIKKNFDKKTEEYKKNKSKPKFNGSSPYQHNKTTFNKSTSKPYNMDDLLNPLRNQMNNSSTKTLLEDKRRK